MGQPFFMTPNGCLQLYMDASGTLGYGAGLWVMVQSKWPQHVISMPIEWNELYAIVMACEAWGRHWAGKRILFHYDYKAVVTEVWQSGLSHSTQLMRLVRALFFIAANGNFHVLIRHIAGVDNCIANALPRPQVQKFRQLAPQAAL